MHGMQASRINLRRDYWLPLLCCLPAIIWGICFTSNKVSLGYFTPVEQVTLQLAAAVIASFVIVVVCRLWRRLSIRDIGILGLCGLFEPGLTYLFGQHGLMAANAGIASVMFSSEAVLTVLLLALLRVEHITRGMLALAALPFAGMALIVSPELSNDATGMALGYGLVALSVLMASLYALVSAALPIKADAIFLVFIQQIFALLFLLTYAAAADETIVPHHWQKIPAGQWINLLLSGVAQFSIAFALFQLALRRSPYMAVVFLDLSPLVGLLAGYLVLGETLGSLQLIGVAITVGALSWITYLKLST